MKQIELHYGWKIRPSTGQRGGLPHYLHEPGSPRLNLTEPPPFISDDFDEKKWWDATVPGNVHTDLVRHNLIAPPAEGAGAAECRWVEECVWFYRTVFDAPEAAESELALLVFEGLDLDAAVYLNGRLMGRHRNAFYPCEIDVSGRLKSTGNVLTVRLESGLFSAADRPISDFYTATHTPDALLHKRNWLRKPQSQAEWDWAPRLMNVGIFAPVRLKYGNGLIVGSVCVNSETAPDLQSARLRVRAFASRVGAVNRPVTLIVDVEGRRERFIYEKVPADGVFEGTVAVENPRLWWPRGYGPGYRYDVGVELRSGDESLYAETLKTGFRHVRVDRSPLPEGERFVFEINGVPVFMRGANLVPIDLFPSAMTPARYETVLARAEEAGFNFLRVWGGGLYENECFYDLCDRNGIMVWQDFAAACAVLPVWDEAFRADIEREAVWQFRRIAKHPSAVAWCGNNEIEMGAYGQTAFRLGQDRRLYFEILPQILKREDPEKYYQPSSPFSPDGSDPNNERSGDQHVWNVGFTDKDWRKYDRSEARFPNEGGVLGSPSLKAVKASLRKGEEYPHSFTWQLHDNMLESWAPGSSPDEDVRFWLGKEIAVLSLEECVFASGAVQAEGLKRFIDNYRRRKYVSSAAVFWMFNDVWPAVRSWSIIDCYGNRNPAFHPVRRCFSEVAAVLAQPSDAFIVFGVNDTLRDVPARLRFGAFRPNGTSLWEREIPVTLPANASTPLAELPKFLCDEPDETRVVFAELTDEAGILLSRTRRVDCLLKDLALEPADIRVTKTPEGYRFCSDRFVMHVCLDLNGDTDLSDNFFDLFPNRPYEVRTGERNAENPVLFTLNDFLRK